ncbi:MAG: endonuclease/exonuclease/phosphatase family protein [Actinomycetia bacterium]|nr:endonuclease/exonuclease/phosphatase family protein [Actinomycetes bacterium]
MRRFLSIIGLALAIIALIVAAYVAYVYLSYHRIPDNQMWAFDVEETDAVPLGKDLTAVTFNIGFGAYVPEYSFFMDGGTESRAFSMQDATNAVNGAMELAKSFNPDFVLLQEVDIKADRSYRVNQLNLVKRKFPEFYTHEAINYDSAYLFYPLTDPIGKSQAAIVTSSRFPMSAFTRRSLPMPTDFSKFLDLDRCYTVSEIPTKNEKTLCIYNVHLIAYGGSTDIATAQVQMLLDDMEERAKAGDYVICGGDFNHDLLDSFAIFNGEGHTLPGWAHPFPIDLIPDGITLLNEYTNVEDKDEDLIPTSRDANKPYTGPEGHTLVIIDGFLVSDNVEVKSIENIDAQFEFSDHNPVVLRFRLIDDPAPAP